jgi:hypothetical protein
MSDNGLVKADGTEGWDMVKNFDAGTAAKTAVPGTGTGGSTGTPAVPFAEAKDKIVFVEGFALENTTAKTGPLLPKGVLTDVHIYTGANPLANSTFTATNELTSGSALTFKDGVFRSSNADAKLTSEDVGKILGALDTITTEYKGAEHTHLGAGNPPAQTTVAGMTEAQYAAAIGSTTKSLSPTAHFVNPTETPTEFTSNYVWAVETAGSTFILKLDATQNDTDHLKDVVIELVGVTGLSGQQLESMFTVSNVTPTWEVPSS